MNWNDQPRTKEELLLDIPPRKLRGRSDGDWRLGIQHNQTLRDLVTTLFSEVDRLEALIMSLGPLKAAVPLVRPLGLLSEDPTVEAVEVGATSSAEEVVVAVFPFEVGRAPLGLTLALVWSAVVSGVGSGTSRWMLSTEPETEGEAPSVGAEALTPSFSAGGEHRVSGLVAPPVSGAFSLLLVGSVSEGAGLSLSVSTESEVEVTY